MSEIEKYLQMNIEFTPAVVCFLTKKDQVLLGLRKKVSLGLGKNLIAGIGGKIGDLEKYKNESAEEALVREVKEEIGVMTQEFTEMGRVRFIFPKRPKWTQDVKIYIVHKWSGEPQETDVIKPFWFDIANLPKEQMWEDNAYWVPKVLAGEKTDVIFLLDKDGTVKEYKFE